MSPTRNSPNNIKLWGFISRILTKRSKSIVASRDLCQTVSHWPRNGNLRRYPDPKLREPWTWGYPLYVDFLDLSLGKMSHLYIYPIRFYLAEWWFSSSLRQIIRGYPIHIPSVSHEIPMNIFHQTTIFKGHLFNKKRQMRLLQLISLPC